jgi:hypothetical protein
MARSKNASFDFTSTTFAPMFSAAAGSVAAVTKDITVGGYIDNKYLEMTAKANNFAAAPFILGSSTGWTVPTPATAVHDNCEITPGTTLGPAFTVGTDPAFFARAKFKCTTQNKVEIAAVGFRTQGAYAASGDATAAAFGAAYADLAYVGVIDTTAAGTVKSLTDITGSGGATLTLATKAAVAATNVVTFEVRVSAAGVVSYLINGAADTLLAAAAAVTIPNATVLVPSVVISVDGAAASDWLLQEFTYGYQDTN